MNSAAHADLDTVPDAIRACLSELFDWLSPDDLTEDASLADDLGLDSMHLVELQASLESRLGFEFDPLDDELADAFADVGTLTEYVRQFLARQ